MTQHIFEQISILINEGGMNVIEVKERFFLYTSIEFSYNSSTRSVDYISFKGIDISEFLKMQKPNLTPIALLQSLEARISNIAAVSIKFSKYDSYFCYSS